MAQEGAGTPWALATVDGPDGLIGCVEAGGAFYAIEPSLRQAGLPGIGSTIALFDDCKHSKATLATAGRLELGNRVEGRRLATLLYPGRFLCAGSNCFDHLAEMDIPEAGKVGQCLLFMKSPRNAVVGEGDTVHMPIGTKAFDREAKLAVVIGRSASMIFSIAERIAVASRIVTLDPGDMLLNGTPAGVGAPRDTFLSVGDDVEAESIGRPLVTIQPAIEA